MTETTARHILTASGYTTAERRYARHWLMQRRLFPGDSALLHRAEPGPLTYTIGEVIQWRSQRPA